MVREKEYGSWSSPLKADMVASGTMGLSEIRLDGGRVYWLESRPDEGGRTVPVLLGPDGDKVDVIPDGYDARSRVHEYGGGSYLVEDGVVYFTNFEDGRLYRVVPGGEPRPLTPEDELRFADLRYDRERGRLVSVCEDHSKEGSEPENYLVSLNPEKLTEPRVLARGHDFYSSPRLSPEEDRLAWVTWDYPSMPWDGTELHLGELDEAGGIATSRVVAGGPSESVVQPRWGPDGDLYYVSDKEGWWRIYRRAGEEVVTGRNAEHARPRWQFGNSSYDFPGLGEVVFTYTKGGRWFLAEKDLVEGKEKTFDLPYSQISSVRAEGNDVFFVGGGPKSPKGVRKLDRETGELRTLRVPDAPGLEEGFISTPERLEYPSGDGDLVHGFYYPPENEEYAGPQGEKPPLIVLIHGGPTSAAGDALSREVQFWTSRGMGVLDVNYRGSTGYGRDYREKLKGEWGRIDVEDCAAGASYLVDEGRVDPERLIIRGGSAGGFTTLAALAFTDVFDAGASYYGVSDPAALTEGTHKFESHYLEGLIGPYPEEEELYRRRAPLEHVDSLTAPTVFFQGTEDRVVPPSQAEAMYSSLKERGVPTAYLPFEGEQHGFRREENIARALEAELYFYSRVFGFEPEEGTEELDIANLD